MLSELRIMLNEVSICAGQLLFTDENNENVAPNMKQFAFPVVLKC